MTKPPSPFFPCGNPKCHKQVSNFAILIPIISNPSIESTAGRSPTDGHESNARGSSTPGGVGSSPGLSAGSW